MLKIFQKAAGIVLALSIFLGGAGYGSANTQPAVSSEEAIYNTAGSLYLKYQQEKENFDTEIMKGISGKAAEMELDKVLFRLEQFCTGPLLDQYADRVNKIIKGQEWEPVYTNAGELKNSRIIRETEQEVVVRQYREVKTGDTTQTGGNKLYIEQYIFLEKLGEWKLRGVLRSDRLSLSPQDVVVDYHYADVTGDGQKEEITLIAARDNPGGIYTQKTRLVVAEKEYLLNPEEYVGYGPGMQLVDLNGDKVDDFLVFMGTGGSAGAILYYSFTIKDNHFKELIGINDNTGMVPLTMQFLDYYRVAVQNDRWKIDEILDVSTNKETYENIQTYQNGKLIRKQETPYMDPYISLQPVDVDDDGQYELMGTQFIRGFWHADTLAEFKTLMKYKEGKWHLVQYRLRDMTILL